MFIVTLCFPRGNLTKKITAWKISKGVCLLWRHENNGMCLSHFQITRCHPPLYSMYCPTPVYHLIKWIIYGNRGVLYINHQYLTISIEILSSGKAENLKLWVVSSNDGHVEKSNASHYYYYESKIVMRLKICISLLLICHYYYYGVQSTGWQKIRKC